MPSPRSRPASRVLFIRVCEGRVGVGGSVGMGAAAPMHRHFPSPKTNTVTQAAAAATAARPCRHARVAEGLDAEHVGGALGAEVLGEEVEAHVDVVGPVLAPGELGAAWLVFGVR